MTTQQALLFGLFGLVLALLVSNRVRHDLVAAGGLMVAVLLGLVPEDRVFSGFANPAVMVVALVLVASRAVENSGALNLIAGRLAHDRRSVSLHLMVIGGVGAALSSVINNVAALAMLMPIDMQAARKAGRAPGLTLMPLAFATILGGMITLIGTPPNLIASAVRQQRLGEPYHMFDFLPVGLPVALAGLAYVALAGWRLVAGRGRKTAAAPRAADFLAELRVPDGAAAVGRLVAELETEAESADVVILGLVRGEERFPGRARFVHVQAGDAVVAEGASDAIAAFMNALGLLPSHEEQEGERPAAGQPAQGEAAELAILEVVVRAEAPIAWRTAVSFRLRTRFGVTLLGISRQGRTIREHVQEHLIEPGDLLLLTGRRAALADVADWLGGIPLNEVAVAPVRAWRIALAIGLFVLAVAGATLGLVSFPIAIAIAVVGYAGAGLVPAREFYDQIDWSVIVMLACLLPLGEAFDRVGGTGLIAGLIMALTHGQSPVVALVVLMIAVMALTDVLNNLATIVIAGPLALSLADRLGVNPDAFLMGAAVATSCAFLTPIGHKNNTLVMGPGGYAFRDYWRMGLPLEIVVLAVAVPMLLLVWPL